MRTTSEKLTYLNTTKEKIRDSINLTGANIGTSDTFRSYADKLKLGYIDIINNGIDNLYNNFPKVSGIGSNLSLTPTYEAPMKLNEIQGDTFQQTYEGNNLLNPIPNTLPNTLNGISVTRNTDGSLDINGTATSNWANITNKISTNLEPNTYKFLINRELTHTIVLRLTYSDETYSDLNILAGSKKREITTAKTIVSYYVYLILNAGTTYSEKVYLQLKLSSSSDDYEPYVGGTASPNPDYPQTIQNVTGLQNIEVCGKNLFDKSTIIENKYIDASGNFINNNDNFIGDFISIDNTKSYYINASSGQAKRIAYYDNSKSFISRQLISAVGGLLTIPNNAKYVRLSCYNVNLDSLQLEQNNQATTYEPYKGNTYEVNLGKQLFNKDEIIANEQYLNKANVSDLMANDTGISWTATSNDSYIGLPAEITGGYGMLMKVNPNTSYTLSFDTNYELTLYAFYIASDYTFIQRNVPLGHNSGVSFTTPSNCEYIFIRFGAQNQTGNTINITNIQIEKGSQVTSYSPYFTPIELCKIGTYQDYIYKSNGNWYIHKEIRKYQITGYEGYLKDGNNYAIDPSTARNDFLKNSDGGNCLCTHFFSKLEAKNNYCWIGNGSFFVVCKTDVSDVSEFRNLMREITPTLYYILSTPTDTLITNTELIEDLETLYTAKSQEGTTNISITSEDLEMILNISALRGEV